MQRQPQKILVCGLWITLSKKRISCSESEKHNSVLWRKIAVLSYHCCLSPVLNQSYCHPFVCLTAKSPLPVPKIRLDRDTSQDAPLRKHSPASGGQRLRHHHPRFRHQRPHTARPRPYLLRMDATNRNRGQTAREQSDVRLRSPGHLHGAVGLRGLDIRHPEVTRMDVVGV